MKHILYKYIRILLEAFYGLGSFLWGLIVVFLEILTSIVLNLKNPTNQISIVQNDRVFTPFSLKIIKF